MKKSFPFYRTHQISNALFLKNVLKIKLQVPIPPINLGLVFDNKLSFKNHISSITKPPTFISSELKKRTSLARNLT